MTTPSIDHIEECLIPAINHGDNGTLSGQAALLVPLMFENDQWHLLLTRRADSLRSHSGEVAFPGGMWEESDHFPVVTALREAYEEVGLSQDAVNVLGLLEAQQTRRETKVRPVVACIPSTAPLLANEAEIASIFKVPLAFVSEDQRLRTDIFRHHWVPAYDYQGYEIWGFTSAVIIRMMTRCFGVHFSRQHNAPEKVW